MIRVGRRLLASITVNAVIVLGGFSFAAPAAAESGRSPGVFATPTCPSGWFCFYDDTRFGDPYGKLSDCGWQNLATWGWQNRTEAVYYNLPSGSASFYESNGTFLFKVSAASRSISDVYPKQNKADKVYRSC
ncbi:peptidase inhibitor family I36 protein [Micromonospora sp. CA-248260]|uniref:peptidase inhibitor family I36 protein n=1 Tax=Micromonospora sp. CA-248260 TaxID=3239962 RepID=UPI003D8B3AA2